MRTKVNRTLGRQVLAPPYESGYKEVGFFHDGSVHQVKSGLSGLEPHGHSPF
jgi:hypothetical protein